MSHVTVVALKAFCYNRSRFILKATHVTTAMSEWVSRCRFHPDRQAVEFTEKGPLCKECFDDEAIFHVGMGNNCWFSRWSLSMDLLPLEVRRFLERRRGREYE